MTISPMINNLFSWIEKKSTKKNYPFYLTLLLISISLFLAFPRFDLYGSKVSWDVTMLKANDLTNNLTHIPPESFLAKKVFRLTVPVIIKLFHLNRIAVLVIQFIIGFLLILFSYKLANRIIKDAVSATFLAAGVVFLYCGRACFTDIIYTWFDGWAYFFILMALYNKNIFSVFLFVTLAAWIDERAFIALPAIILFHQINTGKDNQFGAKRLFAFTSSGISVIAAMAGYIGLRLFLTSRYNMHTPNELANFSVFKENIIHTAFGFGAYTFFEGFWLLFAILLVLTFKNKHYVLLTLVFLQILASSIAALFVNDITRSGSYLFPMLFVFLAYLSNFIEPGKFRFILLVCMFFSFLFPPINYVSFGDFLFRIEKPFFWVLHNLIFR